MFREAEHGRLFHNVSKQIEKVILSGVLKPGDRLPPERELRETFKIGRPTLREALRVLEQKGLVEIRVGAKGGAYVKKTGVEQIADGLVLLIRRNQVSLRHLYEFRESVEDTIAGLATERGTDADFNRLTRLLEELGQLADASHKEALDAFYNVESRLHIELANISRNPIYQWVMSAVNYNYSHLLPNEEHDLQAIYLEWCQILKAMKNREVTKVQGMIKTHVIKYSIFVRDAGQRQGKSLSDIILDL
jgi:DNA-binding FadR family transcriptional regulator